MLLKERATTRPLVYTTFWLEHKLWGFDPTGYHIVNVLLHWANTLLVWYLVRRLAVPGAWMVAAVFAVHPLHVESVAWVIERKDMLSGLFYLAAVLTWIRFVEQPRLGRYACPLVLYAAALLSKSIAITLPTALLIWHWWQQGRVTSTDLLRLVPFGVIGLVIALGDLSFYQSVEPLSLGYSLIERTLIAARALWFYAGKLLWPSELAVIYPHWDIHVANPLAWGYLITAVALAGVLWHFRHQIGRGAAGWGVVFCDYVVSGVRLCRLWLYAVCFCRRSLSVPRRYWGYGCRHRLGFLRCASPIKHVAKGCARCCGGGLGCAGNADLAAGKHLSRQRNPQSPHHRAQPARHEVPT